MPRVIKMVMNQMRLIEYQRAARILDLQCFILDFEKKYETCADISSDAKPFFMCVERETFCTEYSRLRDFIMLCNDLEYKRLAETRVEVSHTM